MAVGDFNANLLKQSIFSSELIKFCHENAYVLDEQSKLPGHNFTFHSDAHDSMSWIDHALWSMSVYQIIDNMGVLYQYLTSDHFPLTLCLNVPYAAVPKQASDNVQMSTVQQKGDWGQLPVEPIKLYAHNWCFVRDLVLPDDAITCSGGHCTNQGHVDMLSSTYGHIMNCLQKADEISIPPKHKHFLLLFQVGINICLSLIMNRDKHMSLE